MINYIKRKSYALFPIFVKLTNYSIPKNVNLLFVILIIWVLEWSIVIEYLFGELWHGTVLFPIKIPIILLSCLLYWFYLWGMAVWRRTQFGKFTRGERKLWAKAITSFWVAEFVTILSFVLVYMWMSWGPLPLEPRTFWMSRKGIIIEIVIYSYIIFLAYIAKFAMKWNLWNYQLTISLVIILIFSYLLWKDIILLLLRESMYSNTTAKWRNLRCSAVIYTLSHEWWTQHIVGLRSARSRYPALKNSIVLQEHPFINIAAALTEYESNNFLQRVTVDQRINKIYPFANLIFDFTPNEYWNNPIYIDEEFYPRRTGFIPKRLAMWQLLMVLKMWHHLIILLWWLLYIYKLIFRKKNSYTMLNVCYFNVYCCYILALIIYALYMLPSIELYMKFRPGMFSFHRLILIGNHALNYNWRLLVTSFNGDTIEEFEYLYDLLDNVILE